MSLLTMSAQLAEGFLITVEIFVLTLLFSLPLGLIVAFGRMSGCKVIRIISKIYISIMRGTPLMLQIIVVYFAPFYVFRMQVGTGYRFPAVILAFVINYAAYFAEIYRAGIESIPVGQYEAAEVLGYSKAQTFVKIILPQVVKRVLPPVTNETITLVKDTSMAFTISIAEMFTVAKQIGAAQTSVLPQRRVVKGVLIKFTKNPQKRVPETFEAPDTPAWNNYRSPFNSFSQRYAYSGNWSM